MRAWAWPHTVGLVYAKTLIPGPNAVPALMATTDDADVLLPQLLDRGWAVFGEPLPQAAAGRLVVGSDRLQLVVDDQALLDDLNPYAPDGWWAAIDGTGGCCVVVIARDGASLESTHPPEPCMTSSEPAKPRFRSSASSGRR